MMATVCRVGPGEGARLREIRLRALRDAPEAFATSFEDEQARPESYWRELAGVGGERLVLVGVAEGRWVAMAAARWFDRDAGIAQLWGLWVEPAARGSGLGRELVDAIASWATRHGAVRLRLGVTEPALSTTAFYEHLGFRPTGETRLLPPNGAVKAYFWARAV